MLFLASQALAAPAASVHPDLARFKAADGTALAADFIAPKSGKPVLLLLHGVAAGRGEWTTLSQEAAKLGFGSLALDFRGHGASGGPPYTTFATTEAWAKLEGDIRAGVKFLATRGVPASRVVLVGASIGADLAAKAAAKDPALACLALLSPGISYQGIGIEDEVSHFSRPLLMAAAPTDRYAYESVQYLRTRVPPAAGLVVEQPKEGHGAQMLAQGLTQPLLQWVKGRCVAKKKA